MLAWHFVHICHDYWSFATREACVDDVLTCIPLIGEILSLIDMYASFIHPCSSCVCIPFSLRDLELAQRPLEAMC